jgi:hypothetical protein
MRNEKKAALPRRAPIGSWTERAVVVAASFLGVACGDGSSPGTQGTGGDGSSGGAGGASLSTGGSGGGTAGLAGMGSGASGGFGGTSGTSGMGGTSASTGGTPAATGGTSGGSGGGGAPDLSGLDLTLGGLNQDLPVPSLDCTVGPTPTNGCMSWTGEYNGARVDGSCQDTVRRAYFYIDKSRAMECDFSLSPKDAFGVALSLGVSSMGSPPPHAFSLNAPPQPDVDAAGFLALFRDTRNLSVDAAGTFDQGVTHDFTWRVTGASADVPGLAAGKTSEAVMGVFAVTFEPKPSCAPDASGFGCDRIRVRGTFYVRTQDVVQP